MYRILYVFLIIVLSLFSIGCNSSEKATDLKTNMPLTESTTTNNNKVPYNINNIIKPEIIDKSSNYSNVELLDLNKKINYKPVSEVFFLDEDNIIFSLPNDKKEAAENEDCDLFKYNLIDKKLSMICPEFVLYFDCFVNVKDSNNFSIEKNGYYLSIKNNEIKIKENIRSKIRKKYPKATDIFFNDKNNKIIFIDDSDDTREAIVCDSEVQNIHKLVIKNVYRIQWADEENVLVAYKDSDDKSILAKYNLLDKSIVNTILPDENYFIDPIKSDNDVIRFSYLNDPRTEKPWGFLDLNKGIIDRVHFDSCNPTSILRNGRMAGFFEPTDGSFIGKLFLFDISTKNITIRNSSVELPQNVAVSPNGNKIIYVKGNFNGESRFYINK